MLNRSGLSSVAALLLTVAVPTMGAAQPADDRQPAAEREVRAAEQALVAAERERRQSEQSVRENERQFEQLRGELEQARRQMEAAAREISRLSSTGPRVFVTHRADMHPAPGRAGIGANIRNADEGALVIGVTPGGPADDAGILSGDIITAIAGQSTADGGQQPVDRVIDALAATEPGTTVAVDVLRAGEAMTFDVTTGESFRLARVARGMGAPGDFEWVMPDLPDLDLSAVRGVARDVTSYLNLSEFFASRWHDMELVALTEDLGSYFGTDSGLLVVRAPDADDLDLRDGDVILSISGRTPASPEHALRILASFVPGEALELEIMRRQRRDTVRYTIPDNATTGGRDDAAP